MASLVISVQLEETLLHHLDLITVLSPWRDLYLLRLTINGLHLDLSPQDGINYRNLLLYIRIIAFSPESRVPLHCNLDYQVAIHMPLSLEAQSSPVINTSWNFEFLVSLRDLHALSRATSTGLSDSMACTVAARAFRSHHHDTLVESHEARALAGMAFLRLGPWLSPGPLACAANTSAFELDYLNPPKSTLVAPFTA